MTKPTRILKVGSQGEIVLPPEAMEALGLEPGGQVELHIDTVRKALRLERKVADPWAEALKDKKSPGFEDLMADQTRRQKEAGKNFEEKLKKPPPAEPDDRDRWR